MSLRHENSHNMLNPTIDILFHFLMHRWSFPQFPTTLDPCIFQKSWESNESQSCDANKFVPLPLVFPYFCFLLLSILVTLCRIYNKLLLEFELSFWRSGHVGAERRLNRERTFSRWKSQTQGMTCFRVYTRATDRFIRQRNFPRSLRRRVAKKETTIADLRVFFFFLFFTVYLV